MANTSLPISILNETVMQKLYKEHLDRNIFCDPKLMGVIPAINTQSLDTIKIGKPPMSFAYSGALPIEEYRRLLGGRLRLKNGERIPFDFMEIHVTAEVAFVFLVNKGKPVVLEDDPNMFPSDKLITELRLLIG